MCCTKELKEVKGGVGMTKKAMRCTTRQRKKETTAQKAADLKALEEVRSLRIGVAASEAVCRQKL